MQTSVASGRLGREGSRLERVYSVRECQVHAGSLGSSLLSVLLCLRLFSAPLPQPPFFSPASFPFNRPEKQTLERHSYNDYCAETDDVHLIFVWALIRHLYLCLFFCTLAASSSTGHFCRHIQFGPSQISFGTLA